VNKTFTTGLFYYCEEPYHPKWLITPWAFNPHLAIFIISRINPNFMVALHPVSTFIVVRDPHIFSPFRNPLPVNFPVTRRLANHRRGLVNPLGSYNRRELPVLKEIIQGYNSQPYGNSLPASSPPVICKRDS
jgi:hypothetical protein